MSVSGQCRVEVIRGEHVESEHEVSVAVVDAGRQLRAWAGDAHRRTFARSAIKAWQTLPLVEDGAVERFGITDEELAICCASHSGEQRHIELVSSLLRRIGAGEEVLACGPHWPFASAATVTLRAAGKRPGRIHNNCSGKHAGMLALARFHGWSLADYHLLEHPVQQRMLREVVRWTELDADEIALGIDGCGVATFALPLVALARGFALLGAAARRGEAGAAQVVQAMLAHPFLVGGSGRLCTELMQVARGRILAKVGAEGVYAVAIPGAELGIALKVHDGATRAAEPALLAVLRALGLLSPEELSGLSRWAVPEVKNTREETVGYLRCAVALASGNS